MNSQLTGTDRSHLRRALELAEGGRGRVSPNPLVGAVVVRDDRAIGEGFHRELGDLHAERVALEDCRKLGRDPAGATMYVTLEPCAHHGRQPPCTEAILQAGIKRVVIASEDPSEKASGRGPGILRDAGVEVEFAFDEEATEARLLNQPFRKHARTGLPLVTLKMAMSLDGRTSTAAGDSPWISGERSRALVHAWRAESDAIAVGIGTALADDPLLTARRQDAARQPVRVVFDSRARLPLDSQLLRTIAEAPVLVVTSEDADPARVKALREAGAEVMAATGATSADRIRAALSDLGRRAVTSLFLEGGRTLAAAFFAADQIDQARTFIAPILLGGFEPEGSDASRASVEGDGGVDDDPAAGAHPSPMTGPARRTALSSGVETVGEDILITARFKEW
ncbi:MAG: bifunctional diaminohydroxyphosphoribosylaminopyrimidine deaminase/5-amino-6-(5-phosphoribosylamino)uracil reductase RibD [Solirubrobacterales bacterium]